MPGDQVIKMPKEVDERDVVPIFVPRIRGKIRDDLTGQGYDDNDYEDMHAVCAASGSGTNFEVAVKAAKGYSIDFLVTDKMLTKGDKGLEEIGALPRARQLKVPYATVNGFRMCGSWEKARQTVKGTQQYDERSYELNQLLWDEIRKKQDEQYFPFDLLVLAGYMRFVKGPLARAFNNKAINVHPGDLSALDDNGRRKYVGDSAVYKALSDGQTRTRSSILMVA